MKITKSPHQDSEIDLTVFSDENLSLETIADGVDRWLDNQDDMPDADDFYGLHIHRLHDVEKSVNGVNFAYGVNETNGGGCVRC